MISEKMYRGKDSGKNVYSKKIIKAAISRCLKYQIRTYVLWRWHADDYEVPYTYVH